MFNEETLKVSQMSHYLEATHSNMKICIYLQMMCGYPLTYENSYMSCMDLSELYCVCLSCLLLLSVCCILLV